MPIVGAVFNCQCDGNSCDETTVKRDIHRSSSNSVRFYCNVKSGSFTVSPPLSVDSAFRLLQFGRPSQHMLAEENNEFSGQDRQP